MFRFIPLIAIALLGGRSLGDNIPWDTLDEQFWGQHLRGNGPYGFGGCTDQQYATLKNVFIEMGKYLEGPIWQEALKGRDSPAFNTFFSTNKPEDVQGILSDMDNGPANRSVDTKIEASLRAPFFACVDTSSENPSTKEAVEGCPDHEDDTTLKAKFVKTNDDGRGHWLLCPSFFNDSYLYDFPAKDQCPILTDDTYLVPNPNTTFTVSQSRMAVIINILGVTYTKNIGNYLINDVIYDTRPENQIASPLNFLQFASMIVAGCQQYPSNPGFGNDDDVSEYYGESGSFDESGNFTESGSPYAGQNPPRRRLKTRAKQVPKRPNDPRLSMVGVLGELDNPSDALMASFDGVDKVLSGFED